MSLIKINLDNKHFPVKVELYKLAKKEFVFISESESHSSSFNLPLQKDSLNLILITSIENPKIQLLTIFRDEPEILVNEQTTIASIFTFANFIKISKCHNFRIKVPEDLARIAFGMKLNFICDCGTVSDVIKSNPNGLETNSYPLFNYLANLLFYAIDDRRIRRELFELTQSDSTVSAILRIARHPFENVRKIYNLIKDLKPIYQPALNDLNLPPRKSPVPNQWTLTLKFNRNGSDNFIISGPGFLTFDDQDKVWINNNVRQGTGNSSTFCTILESDGRPAKFSPIFGGGLLGAGFGIASIGKEIAVGNFGWGATDYNPQRGSISLIDSQGKILSPSDGFTKNVRRSQGICYDNEGNLWIASWGSQEPLGSFDSSTFDFPNKNSAVTVYIKGDPCRSDIYEFASPFYGTFDVTSDEEGNVYASNAGNLENDVPSSLFHFRLVNGRIKKIKSWVSPLGVEGFRQVKVNPKGFVYLAALITSRVIKFDKELNFIQEFKNKLDGPWGIEFDPKGTMFVSNFRRDTSEENPLTLDMEGPFGVTIIEDNDDSTAELAILPTGGKQVILPNGFPLYGSNSPPSFEPLMRLTGSRLDRVGNLWAVNNWKPALINNIRGNPGGDGVVVFISLGGPKF